VAGAGPSGLSAAYHLTRMGHAVTIKDAGAEPGGMMRYGIPKYRLPRDILDAEVNRILDMGVTLELNAKVTDIQAELAGVLTTTNTVRAAACAPPNAPAAPSR
jgi:NADPH-dependent glutamate synthase beta subunit-like oxidoreductase